MFGRLLIALLGVLPTHALSRLAGAIGGGRIPARLRGPVYRAYGRLFGARLDEAERPLAEYATLNAFFTRALKPGLRPVAASAIVSPADATVGAYGTVVDDTLVQAKGRDYSLAGLLAERAVAEQMAGGTYATFYLAPGDYHRLHFPVDGVVTRATYVPGALWPVNVHAVTHVADLFAVNERIVLEIARPDGGAVAVVLVGATVVGMTRLVFDDLHTNARRRAVDRRTYDPALAVRAGDPLGHFEFGSTVIVVCSRAAGTIDPLTVGEAVRVGQRIGRYAGGGPGPGP